MERLYFCGSQLRTWLVAHEHNFIAGIIMAITSYFAPVKNIMIVVFGWLRRGNKYDFWAVGATLLGGLMVQLMLF